MVGKKFHNEFTEVHISRDENKLNVFDVTIEKYQKYPLKITKKGQKQQT